MKHRSEGVFQMGLGVVEELPMMVRRNRRGTHWAAPMLSFPDYDEEHLEALTIEKWYPRHHPSRCRKMQWLSHSCTLSRRACFPS